MCVQLLVCQRERERDRETMVLKAFYFVCCVNITHLLQMNLLHYELLDKSQYVLCAVCFVKITKMTTSII